jgi:carbonic anhydrase/acetyltransferase-like protein (isoleucine patch superfamily)
VKVKTLKNYFAKSADIYGNVTIGDETSVWFQAVIRSDVPGQAIVIGKRSNIQDGTVIHVDHQSGVKIGDNVSIGHNCTIHGCDIRDGVLIGMGATILNRAVVGENSLIGAGSLVTEDVIIPPNVLAFGSPAKVIRPLTAAEIKENQNNAQFYVDLMARYLTGEIKKIENNNK